jgi:hypothetical protein
MFLINISTTFTLHNIFHMLGTNIFIIGEYIINNRIDYIDSMLIVHKETDPSQFENCKKCSEWVIYVLSGFVKNIYVLENDRIYKNNENVRVLSTEMIERIPDKRTFTSSWKIVFDKPIDIKDVTNSAHAGIIRKLKSNLGIKTSATKIKYIYRKKSRNIIDYKTREPIQNILMNHGVECVSFDDMNVKEQVEFLKDAKVLIIGHGAACTNMIFTDDECTIVELTLDKVWYAEYWLYDYENLAKYLHKQYIRFPIIGFDDLNVDELPFRYGTMKQRESSQELYSISEKHRSILFNKTQFIDTNELLKRVLSL